MRLLIIGINLFICIMMANTISVKYKIINYDEYRNIVHKNYPNFTFCQITDYITKETKADKVKFFSRKHFEKHEEDIKFCLKLK